MVPSPSVIHQEISRDLGLTLWQWIRSQNLGDLLYAPIDVVLSQHNVIQPDILFISKERLDIIKKQCIEGAPDLVGEIGSSGTAVWDTVTKRSLYSKYCVRELWLVDPEAITIEVAVHDRTELATRGIYSPGMATKSHVIDGFSVEVDAILKYKTAL